MKAGDVMTTGAATIKPSASLAEAARLMIDHRISGLPVVDEAGRLVGIVSEGDFLRRKNESAGAGSTRCWTTRAGRTRPEI